jgi:hypothetical protein
MTNINEICEAFAKGPSPGGYGYEVTHTCNLHNGHSGDHYASRHTHDGPAPHSHSWRECSERWCVLLNDHAEPHRNLSYEPITPGLATGTGVTAEEIKQIKKGILALGGIDPDTPDTCGDTYRNVDGDAYARCALNPDHGGYHHCARHTWSEDHSWISTDTPLPTCSHHRIDLLGTTYTCERVLHHDGPHHQSATGSRLPPMGRPQLRHLHHRTGQRQHRHLRTRKGPRQNPHRDHGTKPAVRLDISRRKRPRHPPGPRPLQPPPRPHPKRRPDRMLPPHRTPRRPREQRRLQRQHQLAALGRDRDRRRGRSAPQVLGRTRRTRRTRTRHRTRHPRARRRQLGIRPPRTPLERHTHRLRNRPRHPRRADPHLHPRRPRMTTLIEFLEARLAEDEQIATAAGSTGSGDPAPWRVDCRCPDRIRHAGDCYERRIEGGNITIYDEGGHDEDQARHIARHDPIRVLADVAAKRKLLGAHRADKHGRCKACAQWTTDTTDDGHKLDHVAYRGVETPCLTRRLLALPFATHPDYDESWAPE